MNDAIVACAHRKVADAKFGTILLERLHLLATDRVVDDFLLVAGRIVVGHCKNLCRPEHANAFVAQRVERLRTRHFVSVQTVYV